MTATSTVFHDTAARFAVDVSRTRTYETTHTMTAATITAPATLPKMRPMPSPSIETHHPAFSQQTFEITTRHDSQDEHLEVIREDIEKDPVVAIAHLCH
jgi:hypothetical protein